MENKKLKLEELKIQSFVTSLQKEYHGGTAVGSDPTSVTVPGCCNEASRDCTVPPTVQFGNCDTSETCDQVHCATQERTCEAACLTNDGVSNTCDGVSTTCTPGVNGC